MLKKLKILKIWVKLKLFKKYVKNLVYLVIELKRINFLNMQLLKQILNNLSQK